MKEKINKNVAVIVVALVVIVGGAMVVSAASTIGANLATTGTITGTSSSADALTIGRLGAVTPALHVDASASDAVTGLKITAAASGAGLAVALVGGGTNENLTLDAKGSGTITLGGTSTGSVVLSGTTATGLTLSGTNSTAAVTFSGTQATVLNVQDVGTTASHVIDMIDAYTGMVIETGTYGDTATAVVLNSTNKRPVSFLADDGGVAMTGDVRGVLSRIAVIAEHTGSLTLDAVRGQLKFISGIDYDADYASGVRGYIELEGATDFDLNNADHAVSGLHSRIELNGNVNLQAGYLAGLFVELNTAGAYTVTQTGILAGIVIEYTDQKNDAWGHGLYIADSAADTGITIGTAATNGINFPTGGTYGTSAINMGTFAAPISYSSTGKLVQMYAAYTGTTGSITGLRVRARGNSGSGTSSIYGALIQADVMGGKAAQDVVALNVEAIGKDAATLASGGWFVAGQFKVEDEFASGSYGGHVAILRLMGAISADPDDEYYGLFFDFQSSGVGTAQSADALIRIEVSGKNATTINFLSTGDVLGTWGSGNATMITSKALTGSTNWDTGNANLNNDAAIKVDIGGVDYWIPLYN